MKISGFTFLRNAIQYYYPFKESILSILPLVDEYVIVLGKSEDVTKEELLGLNESKIKLVETIWDVEKYPNGSVYAQQTDLAKKHCTGDWLIYLQGDEVIHEKDHIEIRQSCERFLSNIKVEGFLFNYIHFWGDYSHVCYGHAWYDKEIRIIRNLDQIHSWRDAQSFRFYEDGFYDNYFQVKGSRPLQVIQLKANIYHYGWVRPPQIIKTKNDEVRRNYKADLWKEYDSYFDFGRMDRYKTFKGIHPVVMNNRIQNHDWKNLLRFSGPLVLNRQKLKHEKLKYRILTFIENNLLFGFKLGQFKNYKLIK